MDSRSKISMLLIMIMLGCLMFSGCSLPEKEKTDANLGPEQQIKDIKAEIYAVPRSVAKALPGLLNDNIYIYREISPSVNLVAYEDDYSLEKAVNMTARAFLGLLEDPKFNEKIDFWIIQVQPKQGPQVLVWGVRPEQARRYKENNDLIAFFKNCEYVMIDDKIIPKGDQRTAFLKADTQPEEETPGE